MPEQEKKEFSIIDFLKKASVLAGILLPVAAVYYNLRYYRTFNITITDYIDFSESFMMFIPKLRTLLLIIAFAALPVLSYFSFIKTKCKRLRYAGVIYLIVIIPILWYLYKHSDPVLPTELLIYYSGLWVLAAVPVLFMFKKTVLLKYPKESSFFFLITISAIIVVGTCELHSKIIHRYKIYTYVCIMAQDSTTYFMDSTNIFVGQTKHYIFAWNKATNISTVIPIEKAKVFEFKGPRVSDDDNE